MTIVDKIKRSGSTLLIFNHGLGDVVNWMPVYEELCRQTGKKVSLAVDERRQIHKIFPDVIPINGEKIELDKHFDFIYKLVYPDPKLCVLPTEFNRSPSKPYLCAYDELGMSPFIWKPTKLKNIDIVGKDSSRVGVHFFGHTGIKTKCCDPEMCKIIWDEIKKAGFEPFEIHMRPQFRTDYLECVEDCDYFEYANETNSLRFKEPDLKEMADEIGKCRFFIGVDSGPLYLAATILGIDNIVGLEKDKFISSFLPVHINTIRIKNYTKDSVLEILQYFSNRG